MKRAALREEDGIALVMALAITVVLVIFVTSMISYTSQNSRNANTSDSRLNASATERKVPPNAAATIGTPVITGS